MDAMRPARTTLIAACLALAFAAPASGEPKWLDGELLSDQTLDRQPSAALDGRGNATAVWPETSESIGAQARIAGAGWERLSDPESDPSWRAAPETRVIATADGLVTAAWTGGFGAVRAAPRQAATDWEKAVTLEESEEGFLDSAASDGTAMLLLGVSTVASFAWRGEAWERDDVRAEPPARLAMARDGTAAAAWVDCQDACMLQVAFRPPDGDWSEPETAAFASPEQFDVALTPDGLLLAAWLQRDERADAIRTRIRNPDGTWREPETVEQDDRRVDDDSLAAAAGRGDTMAVAWSFEGQQWAARRALDEWVTGAVSPRASAAAGATRLAVTARADVVVAWLARDLDDVGTIETPYAAWSPRDQPASWSEAVPLVDEARRRRKLGELVTDDQGNALIAVTDFAGENGLVSAHAFDGAPPAITSFEVPDGDEDEELTFRVAGVDAWSGETFTWDFGDGEGGSGAVVTHTYAEPGDYTVRVTATDGLGNARTATDTASIADVVPPPPDRDGDGVPDATDNCPDDPNPGQEDADSDAVGDACDDPPVEPTVTATATPVVTRDPPPLPPDADRDGATDAADNCVTTPNPDQADEDGDGIGTACEQLPEADEPAERGVSTVVRHVAGDVFVRLPATLPIGFTARRSPFQLRDFVPLKGIASVPVGSVVDARKGQLALQSAIDGRPASDPRHRTGEARFAAAIFAIRQQRARRPARPVPTDLALVSAAGAERACTSRRGPGKGAVRRLYGSGRGLFRTVAGASTTTSRNATWIVSDRCNGTLTEVGRGKVSVYDRARRKQVTVRAGRAYLARMRLFEARKGRRAR